MPINSGYGNGGSFTNASGPSGMDVSPYLAALLARERQHLEQRTTNASFRPAQAMGGRQSGQVRRSTVNLGGPQRAERAELALLEAKAQQAKAQAGAMTGKIPTRMSTVGGQTFATPDHLAMTGAQRQVFLPQAAHQIAGPDDEISAEDADFLSRMRSMRGPR
jgi:hypothetical protein